MGKLQPQCRHCRHCNIKRRLFGGGQRLLCQIHNTEVAWDGACKSYEYDVQKVVDIVDYREHTRADGGKSCAECKYCEVVCTASGQRVRTCERLGFTFGANYRPLGFVCDYFQDGGLDALVRDFAEEVMFKNDKGKK